jgi:hypothetical protein
MEQLIRQSLAGRRFAVMGFEASEGDTITSALGSMGVSGMWCVPHRPFQV